MKKNHGFLIVGATAFVFVFMLIYKQTWLTQMAYEQQRLLARKTELNKEHEELTRTLYQLKDQQAILQYATNTLGMQKMSLTQAKRCCQEGSQS